MENVCNICQAVFTAQRNLRQHQRVKHSSGIIRAQCSLCPKSFTKNSDLNRHMKTHTTQEPCQVCGLQFQNLLSLVEHLKSHSTKPNEKIITEASVNAPPYNVAVASGIQGPTDCDFQTALKGGATNYKFHIPAGELDMETVFSSYHERLLTLLNERLNNSSLKWYLASKIQFVKATDNQIEVTSCFRSKNVETMDAHTVSDQLHNAYIEAQHCCAQYQRQGSDWVIKAILTVELNILKYIPLAGSSYIPLPRELEVKKAIINLKNSDNLCFAWAVLASINKEKNNAQEIYHYNLNELDLRGLEFPLKISQVKKFEHQNNISVNVFGYDKQDPLSGKGDKEVFPLHISKLKTEKTADLLLISEGPTQHYTCIRSLDRLLSDLTKHKTRKFYCRYCLHRYSKEDLLTEHSKLCEGHGMQKIRVPTEAEKWMKFTNIKHQMRVPFTVYSDFESFLVKVQTCAPDPSKSNSTPTSIHVPSGFAYIVIGSEGEVIEGPFVYHGKNVVSEFLRHMLNLESRLCFELDKNEPMIFTDEDRFVFEQSTECHICKKDLAGDFVRDHDHMTGKFRGAAHTNCNINFEVARHIPVVFHNLRGYDAHLIMQGIGRIKNKRITCIPNNMEKYISFTLGRLRFIDSFQFMSSSLEQLVANLAEGGSARFKITKQFSSEENLPLILRKGVYPYSYVDGEDRFKEKSLPPQTEFFNDLTSEHLSDEDYKHAQDVWRMFKITNLGEYHDFYLKLDCLLLVDVFETFRDMCLSVYDLDPNHYFTAPGIAWEASLKLTKVKLELLTDLEMHLFVEGGIRGGVSMISTRYASANNSYVENYDPSLPTSHIMYLDANNLYGWAMSLPLPIDSFRWLETEEIENLNISQISANGEIGYILSVDLEYPKELHNLHNDYPLAPESMQITGEILSPYSKQLLQKINKNSTEFKVTKLTPNLNNKKEYIIHYRNLQQYLSLGLKLTKIHKVIQFRQTPWLKPYIELNTECRKNSKNEFEKDFYKLMNNAVFGKTIENLRNRVNVHLVQEEKKLKKLASSPAFNSFKIFDEGLVGVDMKKVTLVLNRPIYAGFSILDLSKTLIYDFHYNYMKAEYGRQCLLLFSDTDSLTYLINTEDVYRDFGKNLDHFDTSEYPKNHFLYSQTNKKVLGKMKDEMKGVAVEEFVGLRPKMYSIKIGKVEKKTCKGVTKASVKKYIRHENYKQCLLDGTTMSASMVRIVSDSHKIHTATINKLALSPADDKRFILDDGIHSLACGHCEISMGTSF